MLESKRWQPMRAPDTGDTHGEPMSGPNVEIQDLLDQVNVPRGVNLDLKKLQEILERAPVGSIDGGLGWSIQFSKTGRDLFLRNIDKFTGLNSRSALSLMRENMGQDSKLFYENITHFRDLDRDVVVELLKRNEVSTLVGNLPVFGKVSPTEMINILLSEKLDGSADISFGTIGTVLNGLRNVDPILIDKLLDAEKSRHHSTEIIIKNLSSFYLDNSFEKITSFLAKNWETTIRLIESIPRLYHAGIIGFLIGMRKMDDAETIRAKFLPRESLSSLIFKHRSDIRDFFDDLKLAPNEQLAKQLCAYPAQSEKLRALQTIVQKNPFLGRALEQNSKYGVKLLLKYPKLDKLSQNNIRLLYEIKESYEGDTDTVEFRNAIQQRLAGERWHELASLEGVDGYLDSIPGKYREFAADYVDGEYVGQKKGQGYINNSAILATVQDGGIDIDVWLNYLDEREFDLGKEEGVSFSEKISVPFDRFIASIDRHDEEFKSAMSEYKSALREKRVSRSQDALADEVLILRAEKEKAEQIGNDPKAKRKVEGITRRLAQLEAQLATPQTVSLWDKLVGDLSVIEQNKKALLKIHDNMHVAEEALKTLSTDSLTPQERRKKMTEYKNTLNTLERDLVEKVVQVGSRLTAYDQTNMALFSTYLGQEDSDSFQQEFLSRVSADMDHLGADAESIKRMVQIENENISFVGTSMRIGVWNRDPDVDLYLGNETDCCIRIDSDHVGRESTIADYLTDVGMQVVKVVDEKRKSTVVAAWCFVGKNRATGEVALVVDNIEANTDYSSQFNTQLSQELRTYLETYAHKSGFTKIVQGELNNDLELFAMDGEYDKLGGYNREGGYYLEGEAGDNDEDEWNNA